MVLLLLPLAPVFANEAEVSAPPPPVAEPEQIIEVVQPEPEIIPEEVLPPQEMGVSSDENTVTDSEPDSVPVLAETELDSTSDTEPENNETQTESEPESETEQIVSESSDEENVSDAISTETLTENNTSLETIDIPPVDVEVTTQSTTSTSTDIQEKVNEDATELELTPQTESIASTTATTAVPEIVTEQVTQVADPNLAVNDLNRFTFSKDECVQTSNGSFYCAESTESQQLAYTDGIFAERDANGDSEIFLSKSGEKTAITDNAFDDDAPYYDPLSNSAVWHRLVDGVYQIVAYDFSLNEEKVVTDTLYNNMQPNKFGDTVAWQGWFEDDWEIFIEKNGERTMLTDNTVQDVLPTISGTHIVWQSFESNAWKVKVYDIRTKAIETIENADGGSVQNPRFVLVYDSKTIEGDLETKGYDLTKGEVIELAAQPKAVPEEIPDPEQTGEDRALVTPPAQPKSKINEGDDDLDDVVPNSDFGTTTDTAVLVIPSFDEDNIETDILTDQESGSLSPTTTIDLIIPSFATSTAVEHIEDLVVLPFTAPNVVSDALSDSQ